MRHLSKLVFGLVPVAIIASALVAPVIAVTNQQNLAGRPISGTADNTGMSIYESACQGIAYGEVNNVDVLYVADHCWPRYAGTSTRILDVMVKGPTGDRIGQFPGVVIQGAADRDLTYIKLDKGMWPDNRNRIYRGDIPGANWWTITAQPDASLQCSSNWDLTNYEVAQNWQIDYGSTYAYRQGETLGRLNTGACEIKTDIPYHGTHVVDSSSPFVTCCGENGKTVLGQATGRYGPFNYLYLNLFYDGWKALDDYWETHGQNVGARLCIDANC